MSAIGLSVPNYIFSKVSSERGFGNMVVVNACRMNSINVLLGLGLPWACYTSMVTHFQPYNALPSNGVLESLTFLSLALFVFIVDMLRSGFTLCTSQAVFYMLVYTAILMFSVSRMHI